MTKAEQVVRRGIRWLNANVPSWRSQVDIDTLDLASPCRCVLGQLDYDFYKSVWDRRLSRTEVHKFGFSKSPGVPFKTLTTAWRRALKKLPGRAEEPPQ